MTVRPDGGPPIDFIGRWRSVDLWAVEAAVVTFEWRAGMNDRSRSWWDAPWTFIHVSGRDTPLYIAYRTGLDEVVHAHTVEELCRRLIDAATRCRQEERSREERSREERSREERA